MGVAGVARPVLGVAHVIKLLSITHIGDTFNLHICAENGSRDNTSQLHATQPLQDHLHGHTTVWPPRISVFSCLCQACLCAVEIPKSTTCQVMSILTTLHMSAIKISFYRTVMSGLTTLHMSPRFCSSQTPSHTPPLTYFRDKNPSSPGPSSTGSSLLGDAFRLFIVQHC
jgi:hypothetical protein